MSRQHFTEGQKVEVYIRAGGYVWKWFNAVIVREEQSAGGHRVEVLLYVESQDDIRRHRAGEHLWIRNDRRLIRPVPEAATGQ